jgi:two-component system sensor histidine kinase MprB
VAQVGNLSFQERLMLTAAVAVAAVVAIAAGVLYIATQNVLNGQIDESLRSEAIGTTVTQRGGVDVVHVPQVPFGSAAGYAQVLDGNGNPLAAAPGTPPPTPITLDDGDRAVVAGTLGEHWRNATIQGVPVRIYTTRVNDSQYTVQVARSLVEVNQIMRNLTLVLLLVAAGGVALAAVLGFLIARAGLRPIHRLRQAVDHVTETGDMSQGVPYKGDDELGLLGAHFNRMLGALDQSLRTQRQLVADASHELRTPLTSMRTNIEVLQRSPTLVGPDRDRLLKDVVSQVEQLTRLVQDLIDLARGDQTPEGMEEVRLDWIVASAVERAATNWPLVRFDAHLDESMVMGQSGRLDRAVSNLLDNAGKWSPPGMTVEVCVVDHEVTVRDRGPGIDQADLPYVFDRFWRAPAARAMPGSGLGLSIVRQVAEAHRGTVSAELPADGGTLMRLRLG